MVSGLAAAAGPAAAKSAATRDRASTPAIRMKDIMGD